MRLLNRLKRPFKKSALPVAGAGKAIFRKSLHLPAYFRGNPLAPSYLGNDPPLRAELFNADQLEQHGISLAATHKLTLDHAPDPLLTRLAANESVLIGVSNLLTAAVKANRRITPAGEWLLDNFYLIEEQIRTAKRHLPKGYSRELPRLASGPSAGLPRVYDIALEAISHGDARLDPDSLRRFVAAYQTVSVLKLGELWAIPIMLRLALIENLRRVAARSAAGRIDRNRADYWADLMTSIAETDPKNLILVTADMVRSNPPMSTPFVSELARRLQGQSAALALPLTWIEQRLAESGLTIEQMVQLGNQKQAADQVSVSNSIASLRFLGAMDWREFVEATSVVEHTLYADPAKTYYAMDFTTRDHYRHIIENIARRSRLSESEVAHAAIQLAQAAAASKPQDGGDHSAHVGFYLVAQGLSQLEHRVQARRSAPENLSRLARRFALPLYLGAVVFISAIFTNAFVAKAYDYGLKNWTLALVGVVSLLGVSHLAVALVNWAATLLALPRPLPRMDFSHGISPQARTLVVVPTLLISAQDTEDLIEALEVRFLANRDVNLHFGLLTDFADAHAQTLAEDEPLLRLAQTRIEELNEKYPGTHADTFFLFHRPRRWNAQDHIWMGYERKRGKLADLNSLLRGAPQNQGSGPFSRIVGNTAILSQVKYVITLDSDTQLPRDSARQFAATMAHPLNRARYDQTKQRVCEGYGILQPRVAVSLPSTNRTLYARLCGSEPGIDPYTRAVSDVYQDLFDEGSFIGKGIYDVDVFERALGERFPENRILSHDLLEGCYVRAGLLSDVQLYEEYPAHYISDMRRRHRWIRGDWQIARWLLPGVPGLKRPSRLKNPLSALSRWKLLDNLRRSLVPAALTLLLILGWTLLTPSWFWTWMVIGILLLPSLVPSILEIFQKPAEMLPSQHITTILWATVQRFAQIAFNVACLPYEAYISLDAIARTAVRMLVTQKRLLEWSPANSPDSKPQGSLARYYHSMWSAPALASAITSYLAIAKPAALAAAWPILLLWASAPALAWWISQPRAPRAVKLSSGQTLFLRKISRKTWAFFEAYVGPDDHWLPPDNYQEHPVDVVAHRTSPTNMGLSLLANLTAYDFGYISAGRLIERTSNALTTMTGLERHRGHFYNWYDTQSLKPLHPIYISSVDSGNLVGHLLTLRPGLSALRDQSILPARWFDGLCDTLMLLVDASKKATPATAVVLVKDLEANYTSRPATLTAVRVFLERTASTTTRIVDALDGAPESPARWWAQALARQCQDALHELMFLAPWSELPAAAERLRPFPGSDRIPMLGELVGLERDWLAIIARRLEAQPASADRAWLQEFQQLVTEAGRHAHERLAAIENLALQALDLTAIEYDFLFDKTRHLLAIGYNVGERRLDTSHYDLLASEARFSTFVAIAQGQLPQESWFALGRQLTSTGGAPVLLSWSGSMFEYLMPLLVMPTYEHTLLDQTYKAAVARQIEYAKQRGLPWGMSESGYNMTDVRLNYQYRAFGVPGLGFKRGLTEDLVIAPYASMLALMVMPEEACMNLERLAAAGLEGKFGLYEAIDYTPTRVPRGQTSAVVRSFMAHHQGMSLLSLAYFLLDRPMQKRFEAEPSFQATMLLLQERIPKVTVIESHTAKLSELRITSSDLAPPMRTFSTPHTPTPEVQLLSNGRYNVMITNAGGGYSRWKDLAVSRWHEDTTCDNWGTFCYLRDVATNAYWSTAYQPTLKQPKRYEVIFSEGRVEFRRTDHDFDTHTEIVVSPEDDIELRRLHITNLGRGRRTIEITSYAEVVLAVAAADALHPAFSNLFIQTEIVPTRQAILCMRRPRSRDEHAPWLFHQMAIHAKNVGEVSYETDRLKFIGRGNTVADPQVLTSSSSETLSGSQGSVLDPIVSIRCRVTLEVDETATIDVISGISTTRDAALSLIEKYQDRRLADRVFDLAWTHNQVVLRQINATEIDTQLYGRLANSIIYANPSLRAEATVLITNRRGQSGLWGYAISGDLPIVLVQIHDIANIDLVRQMVQAHAYWRLKGLAVDLVIWNEDHAGYRQLLHDHIMGLIAVGLEAHVVDRPGGIFVRPGEQISNEDRALLQAVARVIVTDNRGTLDEQISRRGAADIQVPRLLSTRAASAASHTSMPHPTRNLAMFNGLGGFAPDGREYVIITEPGQITPAPWVNVLANPDFGTVISESGQAYTWSENAHEFRLTPWHNDPVSDTGGEVFYIRDEDSGEFWSPTPLPIRGAGAYVTRHGFGYSVFEHLENGIRSELWVYVALDSAVKFAVLKVRNESGQSRHLSATGYVEWVLGDLRQKSSMHVITEIDSSTGALYAHNRYNMEFAGRVAFFDLGDVGEGNRTYSGDRTEFLGRNGSLKSPAAMARARLSGKVGAALDPCGALQVSFDLAPDQTHEIRFILGVGSDAEGAAKLVRRFRGPAAAQAVLEKVREHWRHTLGCVQVETPDPALNVLANGWLVYQTMACRLWARSGYYQSGGAFGFRDQLQDTMALVHAAPHLLRDQLLLCASRQFPEGDVQHWWHPPMGRGVRTRCSDDFLWLPLATCRYVLATGDMAVLDETVAFIEGRPVDKDADSYYDLPNQSYASASLYEHCVRAILNGVKFGVHGLPLMGSGDWNDGMNLVGIHGKGESVWLGFFLYDVLTRFSEVARLRGDHAFVEVCQTHTVQLRQNLEQHGWDGAWYRRAYFDDGALLGSAANTECQIDSIAQSWSVLSGAGNAERVRLAMESLDQRLVRRDHGLVQLLDPPFDKSPLDPGYIKGYVPGVRENGGQYTHAAIWTAMAFAALGDSRRAWQVMSMINPVAHGSTPEGVATYKVEPYVVAADVYALAPHIGRGGWTWYTGSAGWMYRLILESLLGLKLDVDKLRITPCFPAGWDAFKIHYRYHDTLYHISILQVAAEAGAVRVTVDNIEQHELTIPLINDHHEHSVEINIPAQR